MVYNQFVGIMFQIRSYFLFIIREVTNVQHDRVRIHQLLRSFSTTCCDDTFCESAPFVGVYRYISSNGLPPVRWYYVPDKILLLQNTHYSLVNCRVTINIWYVDSLIFAPFVMDLH